ncbi:MAG: HigA family addiction module antidote protein [Dysgonamonadaceae bacterium]|jgi:addiction module HigA family antidote|nr:HigA family addiction module antidote protein [Dysgonamonadaceae bacterium]
MITIKGIDPKMIANNLEPFEPTHPGELLKEEIEYRGISQKKLAAGMGVSYVVLNDMVNCKRPVSIQYALLFEAALGIPAHILAGLQSDYDMITTKRNPSFIEKLKNVRKVAAML